jgi:biopolymer transport protein ExbD
MMISLRGSLTARRPQLGLPGPDLDVTPVMNMFIILIPFLVSMSAFTHLSAHVLDLPGDQNLAPQAEVPPPPLVMAVGEAGCVLSYGGQVLAELPRDRAEELPLAEVQGLITGMKPGRVLIAADPEVPAHEVVRCLDAVRAAGCEDVGLAAGTGLTIKEGN